MSSQNKQLCVIAMPRTGSELLLNHLSAAFGLDNAGEFLCNQRNGTVATLASGVGRFKDRFPVAKREPNPQETVQDYYRYLGMEFEARIQMLRTHDQPLIVKAFTSSLHFRANPLLLMRLFEEFNVILLTRRDTWKSCLSVLICEQLGVYHHAGSAGLDQARASTQSLKMEGPELLFVRLVKAHNDLDALIRAAQAGHQTARVVYFEDYEANPTQELNRIFGTNVPLGRVPALNKLIADHEMPFSNIERLRSLFNTYRVPAE